MYIFYGMRRMIWYKTKSNENEKVFHIFISKELLFMCPKFKFKHFTMSKD